MKQLKLLFLAFFVIPTTLNAQSDNFKFKKLLQEHPNEKTAFAVTNTSGTLDKLMADKDIIVKQVSRNWIYIQAAPLWIENAQKTRLIESFYIELNTGQPLNDSTRVKHFVNEVHSGMGGLPAAFTGKDVIIGFVDQGIDHQHPDFKNPDGTTRVLYYWDHTMGLDAVRTPAEYGYGQVFYASDINSGNCPATEESSAHGTTVAGAAAANGLANGREKGMAPDAKLIIIETNFYLPNWTLTVADACDFVFAKADSLGLPAIVNLSVGSYLGSHDGDDPAAELMETLLDEHAGRIIVGAAGNSGGWGKYHVQGNVDSDTSFVWIKPNPSSQLGANTCYMDLWTDLSDATFKYGFGANLPSGSYAERAETQYRNATAGAGTTLRDTLWNNGNRIATIEIYPEIVGTNLHIEFYFNNVDSTNYNYSVKTVGSGMYDAWTGSLSISLNDMETNIPTAAVLPEIIHYNMPDSLQTIVSSWNCSEKVISVGNIRNRLHHIDGNGNEYSPVPAYTSAVGQLSVNSSKGPSRHGVVKPDIAACGDVALSAGPLWFVQEPGYWGSVSDDHLHMRNGGTSMASPVVAGIAALYFEKCKNGTYDSFMNDMKNTAYTDGYTGAVPNFAYGYGKIHALDLLLESNYSSTVSGTSPLCINDSLDAVSVPPLTSAVWNTSDETLHLPVPAGGAYSFIGYNNLGCVSYSDTFDVVLLTPAPVPVIVVDGTILSTADYPDLQWYENGSPISGATNDTLIIPSNSTSVYTVVATSVDGCSRESASYQIGAGLIELTNAYTLFPNPGKNSFQVVSGNKISKIVVSDLSGKIIVVSNSPAIDCSQWSSGAYLVKITGETSTQTLKFIKE
jgi:hypothetical protein